MNYESSNGSIPPGLPSFADEMNLPQNAPFSVTYGTSAANASLTAGTNSGTSSPRDPTGSFYPAQPPFAAPGSTYGPEIYGTPILWNPTPGVGGLPAAPNAIPLWWVTGRELVPTGVTGEFRGTGDPWNWHIMAYMENETGVATWNAWASGPTDLWGFTWFNGPALYYANDMDDCDGSPWRRQDVAFQWTQNIYMRCPSGGTFNNCEGSYIAIENLIKGNYAANFGGGTMVNSLPASGTIMTDPNGSAGSWPATSIPIQRLLGAFGVEKGITKFPYTARMGTGKGQKITNITDGTSTTVMFAEIDTFDTPTSLPNPASLPSTSPNGSNRDLRGCFQYMGMGSGIFTGMYPPNSYQTDVTYGCGEVTQAQGGAIPNNSPLVCTNPLSGSWSCESDLYRQQCLLYILGRHHGRGFIRWIGNGIESEHRDRSKLRHDLAGLCPQPAPGGVNAAFCDGSVRFISNSVGQTTWQALCTRAGNEVVGVTDY